ncbi:hypothetical protein [Photobacterium indicum]|uniref:Uncharacterized protein n=1 Tax=Photobacterium indicum TaxID=81447 RepID=A0A2T3L6D6_9GAMM|nr:hypothetical protein [Photobacterium indicum]PSV45682.1 hypothetical protein C9J47_16685 [Photobacterium indicum]
MRLSRRGWNNVIIIAVVIFIAMMQLPDLIKARLASSDIASSDEVASPILHSLLPAKATISQLVLPHHQIMKKEGIWVSEPSINTEPQVWIEHWESIAGTPVNDDMMVQLKSQLTSPRTVEIWLQSAEEPIRVTVYQQPQFWLLKSWQGSWIAISVEEAYLFPL